MLQIAMLIFGIITLVRGKFYVSKTKAAVGGPAYLAGIVLLLPLPIAFTGGFIYGAMMAAEGREVDFITVTICEVILVVVCLIIAYTIGNLNAKDITREAEPIDDDDDDRRDSRDDRRRDFRDDDDEDDYQSRRRRS